MEKMLQKFDELNINMKRNELSNELIAISELIKKLYSLYKIDSELIVKNYDLNKDSKLNESAFLSFCYEDVYLIEKEIIKILITISEKNGITN